MSRRRRAADDSAVLLTRGVRPSDDEDVPTQDLVQLVPATAEPVSVQVGSLARPAPTVAATLTMAEVEVVLRDPALGALVVLDPQSPAAVGLLSRRRFGEVMTGRLGYGRAVLTRRPVREAADWHPLVVGPESTVVHVAGLAMTRPQALLGEDVVVAGDAWSLVSTAVLVASVVDALVDASSRDRVTSVLSRERLLRTVREWCAAVTGTPNRVVAVLTRVEELDAVNAAGGHAAGDAVLRHVATGLVRLAPTGCQVGRIGSGELLTVAVLPDLPDERAAAVVESLRLRMAQSAQPPPTLSGRLSRIPWPRTLTVATASLPGWADPDLVVHDARLALGAARLGAHPPVRRDADDRR